jgi:hypothetical protein
MSVKTKVRAVAAALLVGGVSASAPLSASAGTSACGPHCIGVFSSELGSYATPNFVEHVFGGSAVQGTETGLTRASNDDPSEDFINPHPNDHVSDYYNLGTGLGSDQRSLRQPHRVSARVRTKQNSHGAVCGRADVPVYQ